ncbi:hypothetical protein BMS3Abin16_00680 [archaeon BMS3Abin16]|nr:hypothetical protein BMS3Abin16_00680 [archaeon BMS3Abin16]
MSFSGLEVFGSFVGLALLFSMVLAVIGAFMAQGAQDIVAEKKYVVRFENGSYALLKNKRRPRYIGLEK